MEERTSTSPACPDCRALSRQRHLDQCDVQRCSDCGSQRITSDCPGHDPAISSWTGELPDRFLKLTFEEACEDLIATFTDYVESDGPEGLANWWSQMNGEHAEWVKGDGEQEGYLKVYLGTESI